MRGDFNGEADGYFDLALKLGISECSRIVYYHANQDLGDLTAWHAKSLTKFNFSRLRFGTHTTIVNGSFDNFDLRKVKELELKENLQLRMWWENG